MLQFEDVFVSAGVLLLVVLVVLVFETVVPGWAGVVVVAMDGVVVVVPDSGTVS